MAKLAEKSLRSYEEALEMTPEQHLENDLASDLTPSPLLALSEHCDKVLRSLHDGARSIRVLRMNNW